jgi:flavin reductase (DIM6/NTAB) family NADH-FMN oxidoreductase RutF
VPGTGFLQRHLPESEAELARDSRWPGFFPSPIVLVTTTDGETIALEKVVGASIVNRFPYILALSFCRRELSARHHVRRTFTDVLERGRCAAVQFLVPGQDLDNAMGAIATVPEEASGTRLAAAGLATRSGFRGSAPVLESAYLVYEARLVRPGRDFGGAPIYPEPWLDVGSHRVYFLEITAIQLREDIARGQCQIHWRSLPAWRPQRDLDPPPPVAGADAVLQRLKYQKGYNPHYAFPSAGTVAFEHDRIVEGMAVKALPPLAEDQVEVDNDRARWPCFFPSSAGMITVRAPDGRPNLMPCGSTTILSRHPLVVAPCVSYSAINERYAPRASLEMIRRAGRFGCGVPFLDEAIVGAMKYAGNVSYARDPEKVANAGLRMLAGLDAPVLRELPVHFDCKVVGEVRLGTHVMFLGEVKRILVRDDLTPDRPLEWCPWATVRPAPRAGFPAVAGPVMGEARAASVRCS